MGSEKQPQQHQQTRAAGEQGPAVWSEDDVVFMRQALAEAEKARAMREVPVGCVIVRDGQIVSRGHNLTNKARNGTRHAEFEAIDSLLAAHGGDVAAARFDRCTLYVTVEPCIMCAGALSILGFREVVFGCGNDRFGGCGSILSVHEEGAGACGQGMRVHDGSSGAHIASHPPVRTGQAAASKPEAAQQQDPTMHTSAGEQQHQQVEPIPADSSQPPGTQQAHPTPGSHAGNSIDGGQQGSERQGHGGYHRSGAPFPVRRGLFAAEAVKLLQDFYSAGNPLAPKPHRPLKLPEGETAA